jgi:plasmid stability protein
MKWRINLIEKREIKWKINELKILRVEWLKNYSKSRQMRVKLWIRNLNDEMKNQLNWKKRNQMKDKRTQNTESRMINKLYSKTRQMRVKLWIRNLNDEMKNQLNWTKRNQMKHKRTRHIFKARVYPWLHGCVVKTCFYIFTKGWKFLNYWMTVK